MEKKQKRFTWAQIKEQVNNFTDEQLQQEVRWWGEERGGFINGIRILDEDYIRGDENYDPVSTYEPEDLKGVKEYEHTILPKGTPIIYVD